MSAEPTAIIVTEPIDLEARYASEYYLNVTSPFGVTNGSGWYKEDTIASFSVDINNLSAPGILGVVRYEEIVLHVERISKSPWGGQRDTRLNCNAAALYNHCGLARPLGSIVPSILVLIVIVAIASIVLIGSRRKARPKSRPMSRRNEKAQASKSAKMGVERRVYTCVLVARR